jgi:hypothetical protein
MGKVFEHFDRPDGDTIGAVRPWVKMAGNASVRIVTRNNRITTSGNYLDVSAARCDWHLDSGDHYAKVYVRGVQLVNGNSSTAGVMVRLNTTGTSAHTFYCFEVTDGGNYYLWKRVNGTNTYWRSAVQMPAAARVYTEGLVELHIDGSTLRAYFRGVLVDTFTDTSIPSSWTQQQAGVFGYNWSGVVSLDDFEAAAIRLGVAPTKLATLTDDFDGTELDPARWFDRSWDTAARVVGGELLLRQNSNYHSVRSFRYDALDSPLFVSAIAPRNEPGSREDAVGLEYDGDNKVEFIHSQASLYGRIYDNGVQTAVSSSIAFDPVAHKYRRVTLTAPNNYSDGYAYHAIFEVSANGTVWTRLWPNEVFRFTWHLRDVYLILWAGIYGSDTPTTLDVRWDKLNIALQSLILGGSIRPAGWTRSFSVRERGGSINMAGETDAIKVAYALVTGALAALGETVRLTPKVQTGAIAVTANKTRLPLLMQSGSMAPWASYRLTMMRRLGGSLVPRTVRVTNYLGRVFGRAGIVAMRVYARGQVTLRVRRPN